MSAAPSPHAGCPTAGGEVFAASSPHAGCPTAGGEVSAAPSPHVGGATAGGKVLAAPSPHAGCPAAGGGGVSAAPFPRARCPMAGGDAGCATAVPSRKQNSGSDLRAFPNSGNLRVETTWKSVTKQLLMRYRKTSLYFTTHIYSISFFRPFTTHSR